MQPDKVEILDNSIVQHGPLNDRVYLMKLDKNDLPDIVGKVCELGRQNGYTKLFAKVPAEAGPHFAQWGFVDEARVPNMYKGKSAGLFMCKYMDKGRSVLRDIKRRSEVLHCADKMSQEKTKAIHTNKVDRLRTDDVFALAKLYSEVFETYPFPIHDPSYIRRSMMSSDTIFFGIRSGDELVAAASAELDIEWQCVEMTDFATTTKYRGNGAATSLLAYMERTLKERAFKTFYTIARAGSFGMNVVFSRNGYSLGGTLHNNTQIAGKLESMNVWYKQVETK